MFAIRVTVTLVTERGSKVGFKVRSSTLPEIESCEVGPSCSWIVLGSSSSCQHDHTSETADIGGRQEYLHVWLLLKAPFQSCTSFDVYLVLFSRIQLHLNACSAPYGLQQVAVQLSSFSSLQSCCKQEKELCGAFFSVFSVIATLWTHWRVG